MYIKHYYMESISHSQLSIKEQCNNTIKHLYAYLWILHFFHQVNLIYKIQILLCFLQLKLLNSNFLRHYLH